jgi:hypothetical protein
MFCEKCGKEISPGSSFCEACGTPVQTSRQTPVSQPAPMPIPIQTPAQAQPMAYQQPTRSSGGGSKLPIIIAIVAIVAVVIVAIVLLLQGGSETSPPTSPQPGLPTSPTQVTPPATQLDCSGFPPGASIGQPVDMGDGTMILNSGGVSKNGKQVCKISVYGGLADICGGFDIFLDKSAMLAQGPSSLDSWRDFIDCEPGVPSDYCMGECDIMLSIWMGSTTVSVDPNPSANVQTLLCKSTPCESDTDCSNENCDAVGGAYCEGATTIGEGLLPGYCEPL